MSPEQEDWQERLARIEREMRRLWRLVAILAAGLLLIGLTVFLLHR